MPSLNESLDSAKQMLGGIERSALEQADDAVEAYNKLGRVQETQKAHHGNVERMLQELYAQKDILDKTIGDFEKIQARQQKQNQARKNK